MKAVLGLGLDPLYFIADEYIKIIAVFMHSTEETLVTAAKRLCQWLDLKDENARTYVEAVIPQLTLWIGRNPYNDNLKNLFV